MGAEMVPSEKNFYLLSARKKIRNGEHKSLNVSQHKRKHYIIMRCLAEPNFTYVL
jgi:hypothetical protein